VNAAALKDFRTKQGWSQKKLAELLNASLDRRYTSSTISAWEREREPLPDTVGNLIGQLELEQMFPSDLPTLEGEIEPEFAPPAGGAEGEDTAPPQPPSSASGKAEGVAAQLPLPGTNIYTRTCEELWEMVATGVGLIGAATGNEALKQDGQIILADKKALGRAYGKLAESNDTFRRMILGATTGGAWLEVSLVTGLTAGKLMRNHQSITPRLEAAPEPEPEAGVVSFNGDSGVVSFPQTA
jgi:transcriptional regulator with XRE-family HTH domain